MMSSSSNSSIDPDGQSCGSNSGSTKRIRRRQRVEDLLASFSAEVAEFERGAAQEAAAADDIIRQLAGRSAIWSPFSAPSPQTAPSHPSSASNAASYRAVPAGTPQPVTLTTEDASMQRSDSKSDLPTKQTPHATKDVKSGAAVRVDDSLERASSIAALRAHLHDRGSAKAVATELLRLLARDSTILECNLRDCDHYLNCTLREVTHLRSVADRLSGVGGQARVLRAMLQRDKQARSQLSAHYAQLLERHNNLLAGVRKAAVTDASEDAAYIDSLVSENIGLRRFLLKTHDAVSAKSGPAASVPEKS